MMKIPLARACMAVAVRPASGINIYNVSAPACTMREIVDGIADALGKHPFPVRVPASPALLLSRHLSRMPNRRGNLGTIPISGEIGSCPQITSNCEEMAG